MQNFFSHFFLARLDWFDYGISSANRTGAFIACLIIACWGILAIKRNWSFGISIILSTVLLYYLAQTQSRGALVSLSVSFAVFLCISNIKLNPWKAILLGVVFLFFLLFSYYIGFAERMTSMLSLESSSANCRADIYLSGLKMFIDAPHGFQDIDSPASIYYSWYQSTFESTKYISMINSHLEFMCMHGIMCKFFYVFLWVFIFSITFPKKGNILASSAFCTWICFFIAASFSNVANYWILWVVPILLLIAAIYINFKRLKKRKFFLLILALTAFFTVALFFCSAYLPRDAKLYFEGKKVYIGEPSLNPSLILLPIGSTLGHQPGQYLIAHVKESKRYIIISDTIENIEYDTVIICNAYNENEIEKLNARRIVLINSPAYKFKNYERVQTKNIFIVLGEFSNWKNKSEWMKIAEENPNIKLDIIDGAVNYIPNWIDYL